MRKLPIIPTIIVAAAVAAMIALGFWQLRRADEKEALRARYEQNMTLPAMALPTMGGLDEGLLYRRVTAFCLEVVGWQPSGGRSVTGRTGTRHIAQCRSGGAEGPGFAVDAGVSADPNARPSWRGGEVTGRLVRQAGDAGFLDRLLGKAPPPRPMIVAERAAPGLEPTAPPEADSFTNNSFVYAIQWFFFAAAAAVIYWLALRRRAAKPGDIAPPPAAP